MRIVGYNGTVKIGNLVLDATFETEPVLPDESAYADAIKHMAEYMHHAQHTFTEYGRPPEEYRPTGPVVDGSLAPQPEQEPQHARGYPLRLDGASAVSSLVPLVSDHCVGGDRL